MLRILLILALFVSPTLSQQLIDNKKENPLEIYAEDAIEWHKNEKKYLALGNAKASSGSMSLTSDKIEAFYDEQDDSAMDIQLVKAHKKVTITDKKIKIVGGNLAEYNLKKDHFSIFGKNLLLTSEKNLLKSNKKMEYWRSKGIAVATGKATAVKESEFVIKGEKLVWYIDETENKMNIKKIIGFNNVSIRTNNEVAFSDKALYNRSSGVCKLYGNVKLQKGSSFLTGEYAEVDLNKGISKLLPAPNQNNLNENRVRALIDKNEEYEINE
tara:strand:+ start:2360 stop:3169 length:810 start_codon:yes stop_codon:yes gene_type:complete